MKTFQHEWVSGFLYVWRDDGGVNWREQVVFDPVVTHHQKPDSGADNPDDFHGYVDWHLEIWDHTNDWDPDDTEDARKYAASLIDERLLLEDYYEMLGEPT